MTKPLRFLSPLHRATRQITLWFEEQMAGSGLTPQEGHLLTYLASYAPCPVGDLVRVFDLRGSTATSVLDRMEQKRLIERRPNPDDRRSFLIVLSDHGAEMAALMRSLVHRFEKAVARRISAEDERGFQAVMAAVAAVTGVTVVKRETPGSPSARRAAARARTGSS